MKANTPTIPQAVEDLRAASNKVASRYNYPCGLEADSIKTRTHNGTVRAFFNSPDDQNEALYRELRENGYHNSAYDACYHWKVRRGDLIISYTEGDIDIYTIDQLMQAAEARKAAETVNRPETCAHCGHPLDERGLCTAPLSVAD